MQCEMKALTEPKNEQPLERESCCIVIQRATIRCVGYIWPNKGMDCTGPKHPCLNTPLSNRLRNGSRNNFVNHRAEYSPSLT